MGTRNSKTRGKCAALRSGTAASQAESRCSAIHERYAASRHRIFVGAKAPTYKDWDVESSATRRLPFEPVAGGLSGQTLRRLPLAGSQDKLTPRPTKIGTRIAWRGRLE